MKKLMVFWLKCNKSINKSDSNQRVVDNITTFKKRRYNFNRSSAMKLI